MAGDARGGWWVRRAAAGPLSGFRVKGGAAAAPDAVGWAANKRQTDRRRIQLKSTHLQGPVLRLRIVDALKSQVGRVRVLARR